MAKFFVWFFRVVRNKKVMNHVPRGSTVLDIGCGSDFYLLRGIKDKIKSGVGLDLAVKNYSDDKLIIKKSRLHYQLSFKSGSFSAVTMIAFIEHITEPGKMLKECNRVLKKNGIVVITTPMARARLFWETLVNLGLTEEKSTKEHVHYFSPEEIEKLLKSAGFKVTVSKKFEFGMNYIAVGKKI